MGISLEAGGRTTSILVGLVLWLARSCAVIASTIISTTCMVVGGIEAWIAGSTSLGALTAF